VLREKARPRPEFEARHALHFHQLVSDSLEELRSPRPFEHGRIHPRARIFWPTEIDPASARPGQDHPTALTDDVVSRSSRRWLAIVDAFRKWLLASAEIYAWPTRLSAFLLENGGTTERVLANFVEDHSDIRQQTRPQREAFVASKSTARSTVVVEPHHGAITITNQATRDISILISLDNPERPIVIDGPTRTSQRPAHDIG
jgi:hypothetical protein